jgi:hypothetical protein
LSYRTITLGPLSLGVAIVVRAGLWLVVLGVTINLVLKVCRWTLSRRVIVMKGFEFVRCPFESLSVVKLGIVVDSWSTLSYVVQMAAN